MASTSAREIGFAAAPAADVPRAAPVPAGADVPVDEDVPAVRRHTCRMFGTENGRYDASEHAHDFLLTMSVIPHHRHTGVFFAAD